MWNARAVIVPGPEAGVDLAGGEGVAGMSTSSAGDALRHIARSPIRAMADLLTDSALEPHVVALWGERGAGIRTATREIARLARLSGVVPLSASMDRPAVRALLPHRTMLLIDESAGRRGWRRLLESELESPRHHLLLLVSWEEVAHVHNFRLEPLSPQVLVDAVRPHAASSACRLAISRCAAKSRGLPARFAE